MNRDTRHKARLQQAAWQHGGRWVLFECACLLASQVNGPHDGVLSVALEYDTEAKRAVVNGAKTIALAEIEALAARRRQAGLGEHLPREQRRAAEARARGREHGDLCEYCEGRGVRIVGRTASICGWCAGTGRRTRCSLCHDTGEYSGRPCHLCASGKKRAAAKPPTTQFKDPYEGTPGIQIIDAAAVARMLRRIGKEAH